MYHSSNSFSAENGMLFFAMTGRCCSMGKTGHWHRAIGWTCRRRRTTPHDPMGVPSRVGMMAYDLHYVHILNWHYLMIPGRLLMQQKNRPSTTHKRPRGALWWACAGSTDVLQGWGRQELKLPTMDSDPPWRKQCTNNNGKLTEETDRRRRRRYILERLQLCSLLTLFIKLNH